MPAHRIALVVVVVAASLSLPPAAPALEPVPGDDSAMQSAYQEDSPGTVFAVCCSFTNYYLWPSGPEQYQCCVPQPEPVATQSLSGAPATATRPPADTPTSTVTPNTRNPRVLERTVETACIKLSELTFLERLRRLLRATCVNFVVYDHFPCSCETRCDNPDWLCNCPGLPPGQLPEIGPQDSLGSQPEFLGSACTPCSAKSTCSDAAPPPPPPPPA